MTDWTQFNLIYVCEFNMKSPMLDEAHKTPCYKHLEYYSNWCKTKYGDGQ